MINKDKIRRQIIEMLVQTQFAYWIDKKPDTARDTNIQKQRAFDYYLCKTGKELPEFKQTNFRTVVELQVTYIMQILEMNYA